MGSITDPNSTPGAIKLPIFNIANPTLSIGKSMVEAAIKYGFLYIDTAGTPFSKSTVDNIFDMSREFFASPLPQKESIAIGSDNRGWTGMHSEILDPKSQRKGDFKECLNIGQFDEQGKPQQPMPVVYQGREAEVADFMAACRETCHRVLDLIGTGLEIEEDKFFSSRHGLPTGTVLRLLHYPALKDKEDYQPEVDIRAGAHSDYGSMTLLFQRFGQPGLEILSPDDDWRPVLVVPDGFVAEQPPILVNMGDLLSYWTNGLLKSTVHRVIFPKEARRGGEDRYSIAYFCHPSNDTELVPVPSQIVRERKPIEEGDEVGYGGGAATKRAITANEHLVNRLSATYGFRMDKTGTKKDSETTLNVQTAAA